MIMREMIIMIKMMREMMMIERYSIEIASSSITISRSLTVLVVP